MMVRPVRVATPLWPHLEFGPAVVAELAMTLDTADIAWCLLGGHESWPAAVPSDLDFMIDPAARPHLAGLLRAVAARCGARLVQAVDHETGATWHVLARQDGAHLATLQLDVCTDYRRRGRLWLAATTVLARRQAGALGLPLPAPADAWAYYLIKKIDKGGLDARQGSVLAARHAADRIACGHMTRRLLPAAAARRINQAACRGDWQDVADDLPDLRAQLRRVWRPQPRWQAWRDRLRYGLQRLQRLAQPTGFWLVVLGPDGSGKSVLLDHLERELAPLFRHHARHHVGWPMLLRRRQAATGPASAPTGTLPYARPPRRGLPALAKLLLFWLDQWLGAVGRALPARVTTGLVLYDRHYLDLLADPLRYRHGGGLRLARWLGAVLPVPDLVLVLDAPVAVLQARKRECAPGESARQRRAYRALARHQVNACRIDASAPAAVVQARALTAVLDALAARCAQRLQTTTAP